VAGSAARAAMVKVNSKTTMNGVKAASFLICIPDLNLWLVISPASVDGAKIKAV
jgi:hypothetical protein